MPFDHPQTEGYSSMTIMVLNYPIYGITGEADYSIYGVILTHDFHPQSVGDQMALLENFLNYISPVCADP